MGVFNSLALAQKYVTGFFGADEVAKRLTLVTGAGTPTATSTVPTFVGQEYFDTSANKFYKAQDTTAAADFLILN